MTSLPKPKHKLGYPISQVKEILKKLNISMEKFDKAFGVNTCALDKKGETIIFKCDLERTLYQLRHKLGKFHLWD
jgi:hypothetical protein